MSRTLLPPKFPISRPNDSDLSMQGEITDPDQETLWQRAQRRALAYLQAIGAPTLEGHELVMEALKEAHQAIQNIGWGDPVKETIRILRRLLNDRGLLTNMGPQFGRWFKYGSLRRRGFRSQGDLSGGITSMPPMNRGFMSTDIT
jgi:hypothetical protein